MRYARERRGGVAATVKVWCESRSGVPASTVVHVSSMFDPCAPGVDAATENLSTVSKALVTAAKGALLPRSIAMMYMLKRVGAGVALSVS